LSKYIIGFFIGCLVAGFLIAVKNENTETTMFYPGESGYILYSPKNSTFKICYLDDKYSKYTYKCKTFDDEMTGFQISEKDKGTESERVLNVLESLESKERYVNIMDTLSIESR